MPIKSNFSFFPTRKLTPAEAIEERMISINSSLARLPAELEREAKRKNKRKLHRKEENEISPTCKTV